MLGKRNSPVLSWSLAAFAVIFGGLLAGRPTGAAVWMVVLVFGFALPGLALGACFAWAGELLRMERAGHYLRGSERSLWNVSPDEMRHHRITESDLFDRDRFPLVWENFIWSGGSVEVGRKHVLAYVGPALLYVGVLTTSLLIVVIESWLRWEWFWAVLLSLWALLAFVVAARLLASQALFIFETGRRIAGTDLLEDDRAPALLRRMGECGDTLLSAATGGRAGHGSPTRRGGPATSEP